MAVEPKRATAARRRRVTRRAKTSTAVAKRAPKETTPKGENRVDQLVHQLNAHLNADLEPAPEEPAVEDKKKKPAKVEKLTGEARVDKLVASLNAQFNANLEPSDDTGR
jgi:hypothetical protein